MAKFYIHKVVGGFNILENDKTLNTKGKPTGKAAVFKSVSAAHEFIDKMNISEIENNVESTKD